MDHRKPRGMGREKVGWSGEVGGTVHGEGMLDLERRPGKAVTSNHPPHSGRTQVGGDLARILKWGCM